MEEAALQRQVRELRARVDEVDRELIRALNERARIVQEIMDLKAEAGAPIYDSSMRDIFELIMHRIRDLEIQRGEFSR